MFKDEIRSYSEADIWSKYCGFLNLSMIEFMEIQERLLLEEIEVMANSVIGEKVMGEKVSTSVEEFRRTVPMTTYEDYAPFLNGQQEYALTRKPVCWAHTSGRSGYFKQVPYTERAYKILADGEVTALLLATARKKGEIRIKAGERGIYNTPPRPYFSGVAAYAGGENLGLRFIPPLELSEKMEFQERIEEGFKMALNTGVDYLGSMTSVLVKVGEAFTERSHSLKFSASMLRPAVLFRITKAILKSRLARRPMLPKDLWPVKAIICGGTDTAIYRDKVMYYWGTLPYELYACTEGGLLAFQTWNRKAMTFVPYSVFLEFITEEEWLKNREDPEYQPSTVLLNEVEAGKRYELVFTSFHGMPFLRYRVGDLIKFVSLEDETTGISLPQMVFDTRADDIIDLAGFARLDEKTVWQAITNTGIKYDDWTIRKEYAKDNPKLHLYIELKDNHDATEVKHLIDNTLANLDSNYRDLAKILDIDPLEVTTLPQGSFRRYFEEKKNAGFDLAHLKPPHMNAADDVIASLLRLSC